MSNSESILQAYVVRGQHTPDEVSAIVSEARTRTASSVALAERTYLSVSLPGTAMARVGRDVLLGVRGGTLDDDAIRKIARACPNVWLDARWYPADIEGIHIVVAGTFTVFDPDGIAQEVAALLDVPADEASFRGAEGEPVRYVRLRWKY